MQFPNSKPEIKEKRSPMAESIPAYNKRLKLIENMFNKYEKRVK